MGILLTSWVFTQLDLSELFPRQTMASAGCASSAAHEWWSIASQGPRPSSTLGREGRRMLSEKRPSTKMSCPCLNHPLPPKIWTPRLIELAKQSSELDLRPFVRPENGPREPAKQSLQLDVRLYVQPDLGPREPPKLSTKVDFWFLF